MSDTTYQWIRVEDHEPTLNTPMWLCTGNKVFIGGLIMVEGIDETFKAWATVSMMNVYFERDGTWSADFEYDDDYYPTHWMPLPRLP